MMLSINEIKHLINQESIGVISFDLFDTLVVRECISSKNVISLLSQIIEKQYGIIVKEYRISAEKELNAQFSTTQMIWNSIADKMNFPLELANVFSNMEFELEKSLIRSRKIGKVLYDYAVYKQKRIIVTSDMHFSSTQLRVILEQCGYYDIDKIYVSCEYSAVKRTGELYDVIIEHENYAPEQILHIGDSKKADFFPAKAKGLMAYHLPKNTDILNEKYRIKRLLCQNNITVYESLIYGFAINSLCDHLIDKDYNLKFESFTHLVIFPMLVHAALKLLTEKEIQESKKYKKLFFVSRDGYLIKKAYDILSINFERRLPSRYLLTSRIACMTIIEESFYERINNSLISKNCTIKDFIIVSVTDEVLRNYIIAELSDSDLNMNLTDNIEKSFDIMHKFSQRLEQFHKEAKDATLSYYVHEFNEHKNIMLVDCGFSGTIASYFTRIFKGEKTFDKYFFWTNDKNKINDRINGSVTYTAFCSKKGHAVAPMVESFFSELSGSCLGFLYDVKKKIFPIFEESWQPSKMNSDILLVQNTAIELIKKFCENLNFAFPHLTCEDMQLVMDFVEFFSIEKNSETAKLFMNIYLKESYESNMELKSLGDMVLQRNVKMKEV